MKRARPSAAAVPAAEPSPSAAAPAYPATIHDPVLAPLLLDLHRAVELETLWDTGCRLLSAAMPHYHFLTGLPCVGITPFFLRTTLPLRDIPNYWGQVVAADPPLNTIVARHPGQTFVLLSDHYTPDQLRDTRFYREFMHPDGWLHCAAILFWEGPTFLGQFSAIRTPDHGDYTPAECDLLRQLQPHFDVAVKRVTLLDRERSLRQAIQSGFQHAPEGRLVLDWHLQPVFHNHAAAEACALWSGLQPSLKRAELRRRFTPPAPLITAAAELLATFREALHQGRLDQHLTPRTPDHFHRELDHPHIPGLKARLQILHPKAPLAIEPTILIEFSRILTPQTAAPLYTLTAAEHRVAHSAAAGQSNEEIAADLSLSVNTIRAHLREIFAKLAISRRSQLAPFFR